jgi:uncharacterized protein YbaP (TraB family)
MHVHRSSASRLHTATRAALATLATLVLLLGARPGRAAEPDCPPVPAPPTEEQLATLQREARDRGFLWRISRSGRTSYLYGTLHVGQLAWSVPGPRVSEALRASQTLALELDLMDEKIVSQLAEPAARSAAAAPTMGADWPKRLERQLAAACLPPALLAGQHPLMQAMTLSLLAVRRDGLDPAFAQELVLGGLARAGNKPVVSLENPAQQMAALMPTDPARARRMAEQTLELLEQGRARRTLTRVALTWEQGDLESLADYERWCDCVAGEDDKAYLRRLNDDRNGPLAERIDALHQRGQAVFAAVGALHMTGPQGLPRLMAQRGYKVERVVFERR